MTLTRNQLIGAAAGVVLLVGLGVYIGRDTTPAAAPLAAAPPALPPLPTGDVKGLPPQAQQEVETLSRGGMIFVFFHEAGHMLISELKLPATGPQEDVADEFATFVLTEAIKEAPEADKDKIANVVFAGAVFWRLAAQERQQQGGNIAWYDEHSPDERRYYNILCLATGADPLRFIPMAVKDGVPEDRLRKCADEYKTKHEAWDTLMAPHVPGYWAKTFGTHKLKLQYGPAMKTEWAVFESVYRQGGFFQQMLDGLSANVSLPEDIPVIVKGCGVVNAWWAPDQKTITLCHDFFENLTGTFARAEVAALQAQQQQQQGGGAPAPPQGGGGGGGNPQPAPQPQGGGQTRTPAAIAGVWSCQGTAAGVPVHEQISLQPSGVFQAQVLNQMTGMTMSAWGRWTVQGNVMRYDYQGPPGIQTPEFVPFQMPQPNVMQTQTGTCQKVGQP